MFDTSKYRPAQFGEWLALVIVALVMTLLIVLSHVTDAHPRRSVDVVSSPIDFGPYLPEPGCPTRVWSINEFLPAICVEEQVFRGDYASLQRVDYASKGWMFRPRHLAWVRAGNDAVLIARTFPMSGGTIVQVERNRFLAHERNASPQVDTAPAPLAYWLLYALSFVLHGIAVVLCIVLLWLHAPWRRAPESVPADAGT